MSEGFFIGLGDKTSCGGEVLDGDPRINLYGLLHACEGDRVTCGINGKTYRIVGVISHMEGTVRFFVCGPVMACRQAGPDFHQVGLMNRSPYRIAN